MCLMTIEEADKKIREKMNRHPVRQNYNRMALSLNHPDHPLERIKDELEYAMLTTPTSELRNELIDLNISLEDIRGRIMRGRQEGGD